MKKYNNDIALKDYFEKFDVVGLCETWSDFTGEFSTFLDGYTCFDDVREKGRGWRNSGGVNVFVKNSIVHKFEVARIYSEFRNCVLLYFNASVFHRMQDIILCFTYVSPEGSAIYNISDETDGIIILENYLVTVKSEYPDCSLLITGDFNARTKNFLDFIPEDNLDEIFGDVPYIGDSFNIPRNTKDKNTFNMFGKSLVQMCCLLNVHFLNGRTKGDEKGEFTCIANDGVSIVDYTIVSSELFENISYFHVEDRDETVHFPLNCVISFKHENRNNLNENVIGDKMIQHNIKYKWDESKSSIFFGRFRESLNYEYDRILNSITINFEAAIDSLLEIFYSAAECMRVGEHRTVLRKYTNKPWWDSECEVQRNRKMQSLRQFRVLNTGENLNQYLTHRNSFRDVCRKKKRTHENIQRMKLVDSRKNPSKFWKMLKSNTRNKRNVSNIQPQQWSNYFKNLFSSYTHYHMETHYDNYVHRDSAGCLNDPFIEWEVRKAITKLKTGKSPGPDGLVAEFFKCSLNLIVPILTPLFNAIFNSGDFPSKWAQSIICPIHKKGSQDDPDNFRGISLINIISKIFTSVLTERLSNWCEDENVIDEAQAGFRRGYSAIDNIFILQSLAQKYLSKPGGRFYCLYVDFSKAFDRIEHQKLFHSLASKGIHGKFLDILRSMYGRLSACVKTEDGLTSYFPCHVGTRQGCVSSPLIFTLFINDLVTLLKENCRNGIFITEDVPEVLCLLFADDIANCAESATALQQQLNLIDTFCRTTGMQLNLNKTKIIVFRNGGYLRFYERWTYRNEPVETVSYYKYLGILFTPKLKWTRAKDMLAAQGRKSVMSILQYQRNFGYFDYTDMFKIFDAMVTPVLCYAAEIWGHTFSEQIETVHANFCKVFLGLSRNANNCMALGECGRYPLCTTYYFKCIKYWCRLLHMTQNRYPKSCYLMLKSHTEIGRSNWASNIRDLLYRFGFGLVWISQEVGNVPVFLNQFRQRVVDCTIQNWHSDIEDSAKCEHYKHFKSMLNVERYISFNLPFYLRKAVAKFRCSNHNLNIEMGRHAGIQREFRTCSYCLRHDNLYCIEDEFHAFFECKLYDDIRQRFLPTHLYNNKSLFEFYRILTLNNSDMVKQIANYIFHILKRRNNLDM